MTSPAGHARLLRFNGDARTVDAAARRRTGRESIVVGMWMG